MARGQLVDGELEHYGTVEGVETWIRNKDFSQSNDLDDDDVTAKLVNVSERMDGLMHMAYRERRIEAREFSVTLSKEQREMFRRGRKRRNRRAGMGSLRSLDPWAHVRLPNVYIKELDPTEGDVLEIVRPRERIDIIDDEGLEDGAWYLDHRRGVLNIHLQHFVRGPLYGGRDVARPRIFAAYRHGRDEVRDDIHHAAEKWVAADLINTDSYGSVLGAGPDNVPDMTTGASELFADAMNTVEQNASTRPIL